MIFDTGCRGGNWIHRDVIKDLGAAPVCLHDQETFVDFSGADMIASEKVEISFHEEDGPPFTAWFFVAPPEAPFSIVLGGEDCRTLGILPAPNLRRAPDQRNRAWGLVARRKNKGVIQIKSPNKSVN